MTGRVALVTGAGRGIGRASAIALAVQGYRVAITARTSEELDVVRDVIAATGGTAFAITADLIERDSPRQIIEQTEKQWGPVEILVNNAGVGSSANPKPLVEFDDDFWDLTMALNVTVPYRFTKLVLPSMLRTRWGRIINISSINAKVPALHGAAYVASKHALAGLTKATAREVADQGVTCNAVCPGVTATRLNDRRIEYDAKRLGKTFEQIEAEASPLGRRILPEEVAAAVVFLASEGANAINGQLINVCGGTLMA
jgi:NAD(P)-dependent dehydrogenase (short-subunit alcohol dehydrogenase family)